jgi:NAD(P)-dependent dehydrogenase (short-subunit alcohol dehydrogenase family)
MTSPRTFLVTGATGAIGQAIARQLAQEAAHWVVLLARNKTKAEAAVDSIRRAAIEQLHNLCRQY